MLEFNGDRFTEAPPATAMSITTGGTVPLSSSIGYYDSWPHTSYWLNYPVYICTDKTKKAIEVLKALQAEKLLKCDSVPRFIALVEKISNLL